MTPQTILVVEDNDISRKLMRVALEAEGYAVLDAADGPAALELAARRMPDLVLQDIMLPGMSGFEVARELRALPGGRSVPIVAVTGFVSRAEESKLASATFDTVLTKPVEPSALVSTVHAFLTPPLPVQDRVGRGRRVLLVDDDPVQLKLTQIYLAQAGFQVNCAVDGVEALERARESPPDGIVSDVLMPRLDGFRFCLAVRADPKLARTPVVLLSANYVEEADREMATQVGANDLLARTTDPAGMIQSLLRGLESGPPPASDARPEWLQEAYFQRVIRQLERLAGGNIALAHRSAMQGLILSVVASLSDAMAKRLDVESALGHTLDSVLDVSGVSRGAVYLRDGAGNLGVAASCGFEQEQREALRDFFGHPELLVQALSATGALPIPSPAVEAGVACELLARMRSKSAVVVPLVAQGEQIGVLLFSSWARQLDDEDWVAFARTAGVQMGQAIGLNRMVTKLRGITVALDQSPACAIITNLNGTIEYVNGRFTEVTGYSAEEAIGRNPSILTSGETPVATYRALWNTILAGETWRGELLNRRKNGELFWNAVSISPIRDAHGAITHFAGVQEDISARKQAEEALRVSEARFSRLAESGIIGIAIADVLGNIHDANQAYLAMLGFSREEMLAGKMRWADLTPPEWNSEDEIAVSRLKERGVAPAWEKELFRKDGTRVPVLIGVAMLDYPNCIAFIADLTERKRAEEEMRLLQTITLAAAEAEDLPGALEVVMRKVCEATSWTFADAWIPRTDKTALVSAGSWARSEADKTRLTRLVQGWTFPPGQGLPGRVWASKEPTWIRDVSQDINFPRASIAAELGIHAGFAVPVVVGGQVIAVLEFFMELSRDEDERVIQVVSTVAAQIGSVIQRKLVEEALRKSEEQLRQAQKMEAIGSLAGGVAHDFNNILSVILSYSQLLSDALKPGDPMRDDLLEIKSAGKRAADLTRQLLAFSRQQVLQPRIVNLNSIVTGIEQMLRRLIGEDVELVVIPSSAPAKANVDPGQIEQVVMNLAVNARDAMPTGGRLTIEVAEVQLDQAYASEHPGATPGPHMMLAVSDTGTGMDAATQARVYEPFFTTKEMGKGTGLGLSTVFGIVRQSGGTIWLYSELGKGTTFKVYLPAAEPAAAEKSHSRPAEPAALRGSETILLVEDEECVRKLARTILVKNGYQVLEARSGGDALLICEQPATIHLLLTDVVMPRMSGSHLASRLLSIRPDLKVLYMSGYTDHAVVLHGVLDSEVAFVQKPLTPEALLTKVRQALDSPVPPRDAEAGRP